MLCHVRLVFLGDFAFLLKGNREGVEVGGRVGGVEGGETVIRI